jgi:hypothetical protein
MVQNKVKPFTGRDDVASTSGMQQEATHPVIPRHSTRRFLAGGLPRRAGLFIAWVLRVPIGSDVAALSGADGSLPGCLIGQYPPRSI